MSRAIRRNSIAAGPVGSREHDRVTVVAADRDRGLDRDLTDAAARR